MLQPWGTDKMVLPVTDALNGCVISLPMHTELSNEELTYITQAVLDIIG
jgi:dTDP-4-amino-4,6-dideoxygalactose transaminase